jgi:hypothetical protein
MCNNRWIWTSCYMSPPSYVILHLTPPSIPWLESLSATYTPAQRQLDSLSVRYMILGSHVKEKEKKAIRENT